VSTAPGSGPVAPHRLAGGRHRQRARGRDAQRVHGLADQHLAQHRAERRLAVAAARERRAARALEGDVAPPALAVDHLAQQQRPAVAQLRREAAELVAGVGLGDRRRRLGQCVAAEQRGALTWNCSPVSWLRHWASVLSTRRSGWGLPLFARETTSLQVCMVLPSEWVRDGDTVLPDAVSDRRAWGAGGVESVDAGAMAADAGTRVCSRPHTRRVFGSRVSSFASSSALTVPITAVLSNRYRQRSTHSSSSRERFLARITVVPSSSSVNTTRSPMARPSAWRMSAGMVIWPLLETVA
jgi:hypothetical protein